MSLINTYFSFCRGFLCLLLFVFCFEEPPYFTAEPESVILAEVEKDVDILCQAMGECAEVLYLG